MRNQSFSNNQKTSEKLKRIFSQIGLFFVFLFLFLYLLFPNKLLKSYLLSEIQLAISDSGMPVSIQMEDASLYWFTGIKLKNVFVSNLYASKENVLTIPKITARLSVLPLLIGKASLNASIDLDDGSSDFNASMSLFELINNKVDNFKVKADFDNFQIHEIANQYFNILKSSSDPGVAAVIPILDKLDLSGYLNGKVNFINRGVTNNGSINLSFDKLYFNLNDPSLEIPTQHFKKSDIDVEWKNSTYNIQEKTQFESENLFFKPEGSVRVIGTGPSATPVLNLDLLLIMSGAIEKNFGFLVPQLLKCSNSTMTGGVMNVKLVGPLSQYTCQ